MFCRLSLMLIMLHHLLETYISFSFSKPAYRSWYIKNHYSGCPTDRTWMVVLDSKHTPTPCTFDKQANYPALMYSNSDAAQVIQDPNGGKSGKGIFIIYCRQGEGASSAEKFAKIISPPH